MKNTALTGSLSSSWWDSLPASPAGMQRVLVPLETSGQGKRDKSQLGAAGKTCPCWSSRGFKLTMTPQLEYHPKQVSNRGTSHCHHLFGKHRWPEFSWPWTNSSTPCPESLWGQKRMEQSENMSLPSVSVSGPPAVHRHWTWIFFWAHFSWKGQFSYRNSPSSPLNAELTEKTHFCATTQKCLCSYCLSHVPAHDLRGGYGPKLAHLQ